MGPLPTDRYRSLQVPGSAHQDTGFPSRLQLRSSGLNMEGRMVRDALADMIGRPLQSGCVVNRIKAPPRAGHLPQDTSSLCTDIPSLSSKGIVSTSPGCLSFPEFIPVYQSLVHTKGPND